MIIENIGQDSIESSAPSLQKDARLSPDWSDLWKPSDLATRALLDATASQLKSASLLSCSGRGAELTRNSEVQTSSNYDSNSLQLRSNLLAQSEPETVGSEDAVKPTDANATTIDTITTVPLAEIVDTIDSCVSNTADTVRLRDASDAKPGVDDNKLKVLPTLTEAGRAAFLADNLVPLAHNGAAAALSLMFASRDSIFNFASKALHVSTEKLYDYFESTHFNYFREHSDRVTGLTSDRSTPDSPCSVAGVGFSLSAHIAAAERQWIPREEAVDYTLKVLRTLWSAPQGDSDQGTSGYKGFFYHFVDPKDGTRASDCELSTVDTALLIAGVLTTAEYYKGDSEKEKEIRELAIKLYERVDWNWAMRDKPHMSMGWYPDKGFIEHEWKGYNEGMLLLILAMASPTHPIPAKSWQAYTDSYTVEEDNGKKRIGFAPMFGHQYSHAWIDFRGIRDSATQKLGFDYFENSRRAVLAQHDYAVKNPLGWIGYNALDWGITASDGPGLITKPVNGKPFEFHGYRARGPGEFDDGTLAPTAVAASVAFAPEITLPTLAHWLIKRPELWSKLGFKDAFNMTFDPSKPSGWVASDTLAIDQGPIVMMFENHRSGLFWNLMHKNKAVTTGLRRAGFTGGWLDATSKDTTSSDATSPRTAPRELQRR